MCSVPYAFMVSVDVTDSATLIRGMSISLQLADVRVVELQMAARPSAGPTEYPDEWRDRLRYTETDQGKPKEAESAR